MVPPCLNTMLCHLKPKETTTDLVETGCSTLSHADLWVAAEATERRVKFCQEARRIGKQQHSLRAKNMSEVIRTPHGPPPAPLGAGYTGRL